MKKVVEYKLHIADNGEVYHPKFITNTGWWYDQESKTYIGIVLPSEQRNYYVPDTFVELTKEDLLARVKNIHKVVPWVDKTGTIKLTDSQINSWIDSWWEEYVNS
jgi:hypothetical protein